MTRDEARLALQEVIAAVSLAVNVIRPHADFIRLYQAEARDMESVGPLLAPSLYMSSERRAADAVIGPLLGQALSLVKTYDQQVSAANVALKKVTP